MRYSYNLLTKRNHFGHIGNADPISSSVCEKQPPYSLERMRNDKLTWPGALLWLCESSSQTRGLSLWTGIYSGSWYSFSEMELMNTKRTCTMKIISGFVKLGTASSCQTWRECSHCPTYSPCPFVDTWTEISSKHNWVFPSEGSPTVPLSLSVTKRRS